MFENNCSVCHGNDGKLKAAGSPDLTASVLNKDEVLKAIETGSPKKGMPAYGQRFKKDELENISDYVMNLREKKQE